ncbi:hypothetical protein AGMMS49944_29440 [Spirochaetia bacterium]|nr:hypothetical protein AGMMS49944_29440 [Spirochaetia bacterium]
MKKITFLSLMLLVLFATILVGCENGVSHSENQLNLSETQPVEILRIDYYSWWEFEPIVVRTDLDYTLPEDLIKVTYDNTPYRSYWINYYVNILRIKNDIGADEVLFRQTPSEVVTNRQYGGSIRNTFVFFKYLTDFNESSYTEITDLRPGIDGSYFFYGLSFSPNRHITHQRLGYSDYGHYVVAYIGDDYNNHETGEIHEESAYSFYEKERYYFRY